MRLKKVKIVMEDYLYQFYKKIGESGGIKPEQVMADTLLRLVGGLSSNALDKENQSNKQT